MDLAVPRSVLHLDVDAFFASVEQRDDARLRGRPVAVGTGVVASCSYEARRWGVRTGMRLAEARRLCRPLVCLPGDYRRYEQAARRILAICQEHTPLVEVAALDDLYLELTQPAGAGTPAERVAARLRAQVREEVSLSVAVGLGGNKLVAKVATRQAKPGRQVAVPAGGEREYLAPWPVAVLPGAGGRVAGRLDRLNVRRVGELAEVPLPVLCGLFGAAGRTLHQQARGVDPRPVEPRKAARAVSRRTSFDPPTGDRDFLRAMLDHLLERACLWLRVHGLAAKGLGVAIRYGDYEGAAGRAPFRRATDDEQEIKEAARDRLGRLYQRRLPLRLLGVELTPLYPADRQPGLFPDPEAERRRRLSACKDAIRRRFGFMALQSGATLLLAEQGLEQDRENFRLRTPCLTR
jgi:DNA polymerase IV